MSIHDQLIIGRDIVVLFLAVGVGSLILFLARKVWKCLR